MCASTLRPPPRKVWLVTGSVCDVWVDDVSWRAALVVRTVRDSRVAVIIDQGMESINQRLKSDHPDVAKQPFAQSELLRGKLANLEVLVGIDKIRPRWKWLENDSEFRVVTSESLRGDPLLSTLRFLPRRSDLPDQADIDGLSATAKRVRDLSPDRLSEPDTVTSWQVDLDGLLNLAHLLRWSEMHAVARVLYSLAAQSELAVAVQNYAEDLERGLGGPVDLPSAIKMYERAALGADALSDFGGAMDALQRLDPSKDFRTWAANDQYKYGLRLCPTNARGAHKMWRLAADGGSHAAMEAVAIVSLHGKLNGTPFRMDLDEARRLFASAAEARYARSALSLGLMHLVGEGGPPDLAEARRLLVLGFEIDTDEAEAKRLIRSLRFNEWADIRLHPHNLVRGCQFHLGVMLYEGIGGPADVCEGMRLITLAADAGMPEAQVYIGDTVMK